MKRSLFKRICRSFRFTAKFTGRHMEQLRKLPNKWLKKSSAICHETFKVTSETIVSEKRLSARGMKARKRGFVFFVILFWRKNFSRGFPKMEKLAVGKLRREFSRFRYALCIRHCSDEMFSLIKWVLLMFPYLIVSRDVV